MTPNLFRSLIILFTLGAAWTAQADDWLKVETPVVRAVPPFMKTTAAFMALTNRTDAERLIVAASTPAAGIVELHMHTNDDGVMRMRRIAHIHLPPGKQVRLQPGGLHLMVFELKKPVRIGDTLPFELTLDDGSKVSLDAVVGDVKPMH